MNRFLFLNYGFEKPTPEIMAAWGKWFESFQDRMLDGGQLPAGHEINRSGQKELPFGPDSLTGFTIVEAESMAEARKIAEACPIIDSIRVYQIASKK